MIKFVVTQFSANLDVNDRSNVGHKELKLAGPSSTSEYDKTPGRFSADGTFSVFSEMLHRT